MIAVRERVLTYSGQPERWIWHTPLGPAVAEYQAIACTDEYGLAAPSGLHETALQIDSTDEAWCGTCLALAGGR